MKVPELKALAKERGLKRYSKLRKAELIALLTVPVVPRTRPPRPNRPPPPPPSVSPCITCVQYIGGCSVHRGVFSTSGGYHEYIGGIP